MTGQSWGSDVLDLKAFLDQLPDVDLGAKPHDLMDACAVTIKAAVSGDRDAVSLSLLSLASMVEGLRQSSAYKMPSIYFDRKSAGILKERIDAGSKLDASEWPLHFLSCGSASLRWSTAGGRTDFSQSLSSIYTAIAYLATGFSLEDRFSARETLTGRALFGAPPLD